MVHLKVTYASICRDEQKTLLCKDRDINGFKRNILQSEEQNEKLTYRLTRLNNDIGTSKKCMSKCQKKFEELKIEYAQKTRVLHTVEQAIAKAAHVSH